MKKFLCTLLCFLMIFSLAMPAFAITGEDVVTVYVRGRGTAPLYDKDGNPLSDQRNIDRLGYLTEHMTPVLKELATALVTDDYSGYIDSFEEAFAPIYADNLLDKNGEVTDGSHILWDYKTVAIQKETYLGIPAYQFFYDWRLSPLEIADQLKVYIDRVLAATGAKKVNLYARCYGVNVSMAYVAKSLRGDYGDGYFVVNHMVHDTSSLAGELLCAGLLSNHIVFDADKIDRFVTYYLNGSELFDDPVMEEFAVALVSILNSAKVLGIGVDAVEKIYEKVVPELISRLALCSTYGRTLCYWSLMGNYYEDTINTVFYTDELKQEYAGLIAKTDAYYNLIMKDEAYKTILKKLDDMGVKTAVFAKYGSITFPLFEDSEVTGDVRGIVSDASYGATATDYGKSFSDEYYVQAKLNGTDKYISADLHIDASTCLFPDTTWFIKNIEHDNFTNRITQLGQEFFDSDGKLTVFTSSLPQFMDYSANYAEVTPDEGTNAWSSNPLANLFRFLRALFNLLASLIRNR